MKVQLVQMSLDLSQGEIQLLRKELQTVTQIKNNIIVELENSLRKAENVNNRQESRIKQLQGQCQLWKEKYRQCQSFNRERSHALTHKNIRIAQLQEELQTKLIQEARKWHDQVHGLKAIIAEQQTELTQYLQDHHNYLRELENLQEPYRYLHAQRHLLIEFNAQLQNQVQKADQAGVELQQWALQAQVELRHQNQQGNDLLGHISYMIEHVKQ